MKRNHAFLLLAALFLSYFNVSAQVIPIKNSFQSDMARILADHSNQFKNLLGEEIIQHTQSTDYRSLLKVHGAEECIVSRYSASGKEVYSWQALMIKTEDFEAASKKYKSLFGSLNNLSVNDGGSNMVFRSKFEQPTDRLKFSSIIFQNIKDEHSKVRIELTLENELLEWVVKVLVYDVEREDHERGAIKEGN